MNKRNEENLKKIINWLLLSAITVNLLMLIFYNTISYRSLLHSDTAGMNLIAGEIFRTGELFPKDWNYSNGDLVVLFGHLYILPFLPFFNNGFALHAVSGLVSAVLIIGSIWLLLKELEASLTTRLLCLTVITTGISSYITESIFGQVVYGTILYLAVFQLYLIIRYLKECCIGGAKIASFPLLALSVIVFLVFLSNSSRALATYALPSFAGLMIIAVRGRFKEEYVLSKELSSGVKIVFCTLIVSGIVGGVCYYALLSNLNNYYEPAKNARFLSFEEIVRNFFGMVKGGLFLLGGLPTAGREVLSALGIYEVFRMGIALAVLALPAFAIRLTWNLREPFYAFTFAFALTNFGITAFFYMLTTIPVVVDNEILVANSRYFTLSASLMLLMVVAYLGLRIENCRKYVRYLFLMVALIPLFVSGVENFAILPFKKSVLSGWLREAPKDIIAMRLHEQGLSYGYASYWNASVITVLSKGQTKIRPVVLGAPVQPMRWGSSNEWYRASAYKGSTFLLLSEEEYKAQNWTAMEAYLGKPERELEEGGWKIIVYPFNVAEKLPGWDDRATEPMKFLMLPNTPRQVGRPVQIEDESWLEAGPGETGFLVFGPYNNLTEGKYEAVFDLSAGDVKGGQSPVALTVDVAADGGRVIATKDVITGAGSGHVVLPFEVTRKGGAYEYRVFTRGIVSVRVKAIIVFRK